MSSYPKRRAVWRKRVVLAMTMICWMQTSRYCIVSMRVTAMIGWYSFYMNININNLMQLHCVKYPRYQ